MLISAQEKHDDLWASEQVQAKLEESNIPCEIYQPADLQDLVRKLGSLDLVIGTRLHANILATFNATPCLGIAYRAKVRSFFHDNQLAPYCLDLDVLEELPSKFWAMYDDYKTVAQRFYETSKHNLKQREAYQAFATQYQ